MRKTWVMLVFTALFFLGSGASSAEKVEFFSARPVQLNISTISPGPSFDRSLTVESVKRAMTRFMGDQKGAQIFLLQKFLTDAKSRVELRIKVEDDFFEINNGLPEKPEMLYWNVRLTDAPKVQALLRVIDQLYSEQKDSH